MLMKNGADLIDYSNGQEGIISNYAHTILSKSMYTACIYDLIPLSFEIHSCTLEFSKWALSQMKQTLPLQRFKYTYMKKYIHSDERILK